MLTFSNTEDSDANYWCRPLLGDDRLGDACSVLGAIAGNGDDTCVVGAACRGVDVASGVGLCEAMVDSFHPRAGETEDP